MNANTTELLRTSLEVAVPLWVLEHREWLPHALERRARECASVVAEKGDVLQFADPRKKKGETAHVFNALAEGIAIAARAPGGVTFVGLHFEVDSENQLTIQDAGLVRVG